MPKVEPTRESWQCAAPSDVSDTVKCETEGNDTCLIDPAILYPPLPEAVRQNAVMASSSASRSDYGQYDAVSDAARPLD